MIAKNVICNVCGAACDDLIVEFEENKEDGHVEVKNGCRMGAAKIHEAFHKTRVMKPMIRKNGKLVECEWDVAIRKAAEILANARYPLFFMGCESYCESMIAEIKMAEYLGGNVDANPTFCHGPTFMALQTAGSVSATAGEIKNKCDLIIYWGANPLESLPRHMSHYAVFARGKWTRRGRMDRKVIVVDPRKTVSAELADIHLQLKPGSDYELINALRAILKGKEVNESIEEITGISIEKLKEVVEIMKKAKFGTIYVGLGITGSYGKYANGAALMRLVQELNNFTKFEIGVLTGHSNVAGSLQMLGIYTGYPFGVNFSKKFPRFNPGEFTTTDMLKRNECDAVLCVGADLVSHLPRKAVENLAKIPIITIEISHTPTTELSEVVLPGVHSIEADGTIYRFDSVPLYCRKIKEPPFKFTKSDEDTVNQIFEKVKEIKENK